MLTLVSEETDLLQLFCQRVGGTNIPCFQVNATVLEDLIDRRLGFLQAETTRGMQKTDGLVSLGPFLAAVNP